jgi:hypothetical protein
MSVTNLYPPSDKACIYDGVWWTATSDNIDQTNFKFVFDVYDADDNQLIRAKIFPDPNTGRGYFDVSGVLRSAVNLEWFKFDYTLQFYNQVLNNTNNLKIEYKVKVGEEYNVGSSGITSLDEISGQTYAYNSINDVWAKGNDYKFAPTTAVGVTEPYGYVSNRPFVTNSQYSKEPILIGVHIKYVDTPLDYFNKFTIKKYNSAGTLLATNYDVYELNPGDDYYMMVNIGVEGINNVMGAGYINSDVAYYTIQIGKDVFRVNLQCNGMYELYTLTFLNRLGMFDTARFSCVNKLIMDVQKKSFERRDVSFNDTGVSYKVAGTNQYNETKINYDGVINWNLKLTMDFPTDEEYEWLSELIYSTKIVLTKYIDGVAYHYPCTIKNSNYEYIQRLSSKLKTLEIEVELGQKRNQMRR